jgi:hypothetical protein
MVAYAPYLAVTASLSSVYQAATPSEFRVASVCRIVTATVTEYATARPTTNPHGHGGPYYNPYNDLPLPFEWPGKPSHGELYAPPQPSTPYEYGGSAKHDYEEPCWVPKGTDHLKGSLSNIEQCGNSQWGLIDSPHLPVDGLQDSDSNGAYSSTRTEISPFPSYPTASGHPYNYANATASNSVGPTATGAVGSTATAATKPKAGLLCPSMPDTGVTRTYDLHVAYQTIAPDGVTRNGLTVNGQFPGPLIEANW